ncbi:MAG: hypothetical protein Q9191_007416 [Dirinaria sp. TL-2023a]
MALPTDNTTASPTEPTLLELLAGLKYHDFGIRHFADDGVVRSYAPNGTVLDYVKLNAAQVQEMVDRRGRDDHLDEVYRGVDGHNVTDEKQCTNPPDHLLPVNHKAWIKNVTAEMHAVQEMANGITDAKLLPIAFENSQHPSTAPAAPHDGSSETNDLQPRSEYPTHPYPALRCWIHDCMKNADCIPRGCFHCGVTDEYPDGLCDP